MKALLEKLKDAGFRNKAIISLAAVLVLALAFVLVYAYYAPQQRAEKLYTEAQKAIQKGDLKSAEEKLKELLKNNPRYPGAKEELAKVENSIKSSAEGRNGALGGSSIAGGSLSGQSGQSAQGSQGGSAGYPGGAVGGGAPTTGNGNGGGSGSSVGGGEVANPSFNSVLPKSISGFTQVDRLTSPMEESRTYKPDKEGNVKLMTVVAKNEGNGENAQKYIDNEVKLHYSESAKSVLVKQKSAYFGTDNSGFAVLSWRIAGMVVVIEMQASGVQPKSLYDQLISVANQFP